MKPVHEQLSVTRIVQIWAGAVCFFVFICLIYGHLLTLRDQCLVTVAIRDANQFRSALAAYELDYGEFPVYATDNPTEFAEGLCDPKGRPYILVNDKKELAGFSYTPDIAGAGYTIVILANDRKSTPIVASPVSAEARIENL